MEFRNVQRLSGERIRLNVEKGTNGPAKSSLSYANYRSYYYAKYRNKKSDQNGASQLGKIDELSIAPYVTIHYSYLDCRISQQSFSA